MVVRNLDPFQEAIRWRPNKTPTLKSNWGLWQQEMFVWTKNILFCLASLSRRLVLAPIRVSQLAACPCHQIFIICPQNAFFEIFAAFMIKAENQAFFWSKITIDDWGLDIEDWWLHHTQKVWSCPQPSISNPQSSPTRDYYSLWSLKILKKWKDILASQLPACHRLPIPGGHSVVEQPDFLSLLLGDHWPAADQTVSSRS